jgi:hypothetical protein
MGFVGILIIFTIESLKKERLLMSAENTIVIRNLLCEYKSLNWRSYYGNH